LALVALSWCVAGTIVGTARGVVRKANDNHFVRRLLAGVMLVLFASLNGMDGICCPDGCTHEQQSPLQQHTPEAADGICMLCLGGVDSSVPQDLAPCGVVSDEVGLPQFAHYLDAPSDPVEHPPRS
jgi:hypothetical protein